MTFMQKSMSFARKFIADEQGLAAVEYGLLAAGIAIAIMTVITPIGTALSTIFTNVGTQLTAAVTP